MAERGVRSALLVGVGGTPLAWNNIVERAVVEAADWSVGTGLGLIEFGTHQVRCDGRRLPFRSGSFDLVVSNAVIEHVGCEEDQAALVAEHHRVGRSFVITTPNLAFPVESHTHVVGLHWLPRWRARPRADFTRLLTRRSFRRLLPGDTTILGRSWSPTFVAVHVCSSECGDEASGRS
jgi:2-polyprenyl-3-methyl-5-hydroxy-6-metoxy-1,4-benzoquinol methylase